MLARKLIAMTEKKINVIFFGNNESVLDYLIKHSNINVKSIFCRPADINNENIAKVKEIADRYSIPLKQPEKKDLYSYVQYIRDLAPDLIVVCGYKYIIPVEIFNIPLFRSINIHPSYLPDYRGQHVINWAIVNGESETGVTIHFVDKGIDTGDVIIQKKVPILFEDTAKTLHDRIYYEVCELLQQVINTILSGNALPAKKQDDSKASYFRPRTPEDGTIDWNKNGIEIYNLIRALVKPWPGAYSYIKGKKIIIQDVRFEADSRDSAVEANSQKSSSGEIVNISDSKLAINVKGGKLLVDDYTILDEKGNTTNLEFEIGDKFE